MANDSDYVELTSITDPIEADLFAAYLEDGGIEFQIINRMNAQMLGGLIAPGQNPVIISVRKDQIEEAASLLKQYREAQRKSVPPSIPPEPEE